MSKIYIRHIIFLLFTILHIAIFCLHTNAQMLYSHSSSGPDRGRLKRLFREKTQIIDHLEKSSVIDSVLFISSFSDYKLFLRGSIYDVYDASNPAFYGGTLKPLSDTDYVVNLTHAEIIRSKVVRDIEFKIKNKTHINYIIPNNTEFGILKREVEKMKKLFKDSVTQNYSISDSTFTIFSAHKNKQLIITDLEFKQYNYGLHKEYIAFYKFYVIDINSKKVIFYNYVLDIGATYYWHFYEFYNPRGINKLVRPYKKFLKTNSKK